MVLLLMLLIFKPLHKITSWNFT